jgi:hypothetical protein
MTNVRCRPFGAELRDLLIAKRLTDGMGNASWIALAARIPGVSYETIRKAVTRERLPSPELMMKCASAIGEKPEVFSEYRLWAMRARLDPREVPIETALAVLEATETG